MVMKVVPKPKRADGKECGGKGHHLEVSNTQ